MSIQVKAGTTQIQAVIGVYNNPLCVNGTASGTGITGLVAGTFPPVHVEIAGSLPGTLTLSDLAAATSAFSAGGIKELLDGKYRLDFTTSGAAQVVTLSGTEGTAGSLVAESFIVADSANTFFGVNTVTNQDKTGYTINNITAGTLTLVTTATNVTNPVTANNATAGTLTLVTTTTNVTNPVTANNATAGTLTLVTTVTNVTNPVTANNATAGTLTLVNTVTTITNPVTANNATAGTLTLVNAVTTVTGSIGGSIGGSVIGGVNGSLGGSVGGNLLGGVGGTVNANATAITIGGISITLAANSTSNNFLVGTNPIFSATLPVTGSTTVTLAASQPLYAPAKVSDVPTVGQIGAQITNDHGTGSYYTGGLVPGSAINISVESAYTRAT